jgi:hypothetical protein
MVPAPNHPTWAKLIKGELDHKFKITAASMLFFNLRLQFKRDPDKLSTHVSEARKFFEKYETLMADDVQTLFR